jgi:TPR repeat protein
MTLSEIRQAERREHVWYQQTAAPDGPGAGSLLGRDRLASAQYNLGLMYAEGRHVAPNIKEAVVWFRQAADKDLPEAQYDLAGILEEGGLGVVRNLDEAVRWYRRLASQDFRPAELHPSIAEAQYVLGQFYEQGRGVPQDDGQASNWFETAAGRNHGQAQLSLATMYLAGRGVERYLARALMWVDLAATRLVNNTEAVGRITIIRDALLREMTDEEVLEAHCLWQLEHPKLTGVSTAEMHDLDLQCAEGEGFAGS